MAGDLTRLQQEGAIHIGEAGVPGPAGRKVTNTTVIRWICQGVTCRHGGVVRLEGVRVGARWVTSRPAVQRFLAAINGEAALQAEELSRG